MGLKGKCRFDQQYWAVRTDRNKHQSDVTEERAKGNIQIFDNGVSFDATYLGTTDVELEIKIWKLSAQSATKCIVVSDINCLKWQKKIIKEKPENEF